MANITYTKTGQFGECQYFKKSDSQTNQILSICVKGGSVSIDNYQTFTAQFPFESNQKEFEELYLKAMIELGLIDCFTKLGFKISPTVQQMTIAQWNERISKQAKP